MRSFFRNNSVFLSLSLILIIVLGLAIAFIPKGELHLLLCNSHTPARDIFYRYYTGVAEWFPYVVCVALLLFSRIGDGVFATSAMALSALSTQVLKHIFNALRPVTWFDMFMPEVELPLVEGVKMNYWLSFPSGHTTSFFALAFVVCVLLTSRTSKTSITSRTGLIRNSIIVSITGQVLLFSLAALGGYSRIYLSQHFAMDVFGGIIIGIGITFLCYAVLSRYEAKKWYNYRILGEKSSKKQKNEG